MTRRFAAVVIASQGLAVFFGALVARAIAAADRQSSAPPSSAVGSVIAVLCLLDAGLLRRPWGITLGWVLQLRHPAQRADRADDAHRGRCCSWRCGSPRWCRAPAWTRSRRRVDAQWYAEHGSPEQEPGGSPTGGPPRTADRVAAMTERSLVLVKPDGYARGLTGEVLRRIEAKGYTLVALDIFDARPRAPRARTTPSTRASRSTSRWWSSCPAARSPPRSSRATAASRASAPWPVPPTRRRALPGTIRGDLGRDWGLKVQQNIVHGSDSAESAAREIAIWFPGLG